MPPPHVLTSASSHTPSFAPPASLNLTRFGWCESRLRALFKAIDEHVSPTVLHSNRFPASSICSPISPTLALHCSQPCLWCHPSSNCYHRQLELAEGEPPAIFTSPSAQPAPQTSSNQPAPSAAPPPEAVKEKTSSYTQTFQRHSSSFFIGLSFDRTVAAAGTAVDLNPILGDFMRRVLSWPSLTPGMGVFLNIYDRDKLPRFVHDSMPQPSSTLDCTPVKGLRVVDDSKALSVERRHVFHQINPTTYNSPGSAVDYPPVYPHHQPDPRELGHTSHFEGGRALITAEIFAMVRHLTVHQLFYLHRYSLCFRAHPCTASYNLLYPSYRCD